MANSQYEGPPIDGTMQYISERDFDEEAEKTDVPSDESYDGDMETVISERDDLTELQEQVLRVGMEMRHAKYSEVHEECQKRGIDVSYKTVWKILSEELPRNSYSTSGISEDKSSPQEQEDSEEEDEVACETSGSSSEEIDTDEERADDVRTDEEDTGDVYTEEDIKNHILKPILFAKQYASGEERKSLEEIQELVNIMLGETA